MTLRQQYVHVQRSMIHVFPRKSTRDVKLLCTCTHSIETVWALALARSRRSISFSRRRTSLSYMLCRRPSSRSCSSFCDSTLRCAARRLSISSCSQNHTLSISSCSQNHTHTLSISCCSQNHTHTLSISSCSQNHTHIHTVDLLLQSEPHTHTLSISSCSQNHTHCQIHTQTVNLFLQSGTA